MRIIRGSEGARAPGSDKIEMVKIYSHQDSVHSNKNQAEKVEKSRPRRRRRKSLSSLLLVPPPPQMLLRLPLIRGARRPRSPRRRRSKPFRLRPRGGSTPLLP